MTSVVNFVFPDGESEVFATAATLDYWNIRQWRALSLRFSELVRQGRYPKIVIYPNDGCIF